MSQNSSACNICSSDFKFVASSPCLSPITFTNLIFSQRDVLVPCLDVVDSFRDLGIVRSCRLRSFTRLRFSSAGRALGLPGPPDSVSCYPYKDARHTFRVACRPGGQGMSAPGDSRLTQSPTSVLSRHLGRPRRPRSWTALTLPPPAAPALAGSVCRGQKVKLTLGDSKYLPGSEQDCQAASRAATPADRTAPVPAAQRLPDLRRRPGCAVRSAPPPAGCFPACSAAEGPS